MQETKRTDPTSLSNGLGPMPAPSAAFHFFTELPPSVSALIAQLVGALITLALVVPSLEALNIDVSIWHGVYIQGGLAATCGLMLGLAPWWIPINLFFMPILVWGLGLDISSGWFLAAFILLFLVYWSVFRSQVPLYLSSRKAWAAVSALMPARDKFALLDVGAGLGGMLHYLGAKHPAAKFDGVENAPLPYALAWLRRLVGRGRYQIAWSNLWSGSFASYDVVYAYLSPVPMARLWDKAKVEMAPGSRLISNTFMVPGVEPDNIVELDDFHRSRLYVYRIPVSSSGNAIP